MRNLWIVLGCIWWAAGCAFLEPRNQADYEIFFEGIEKPEGLVFDSAGNLYATSEAFGGSVWRIDSGGTYEVLAENLIQPDALVMDDQRNLFISVEIPKGGVYQLTPAGDLISLVTGLMEPEGLALDPKGGLFIAEDVAGGRILYWKNDDLKVILEGLNKPENISLDDEGNLWITETQKNRVLKRLASGEVSVINRLPIKKADGIIFSDEYEGAFVAEDLEEGRIAFLKKDGSVLFLMDKIKFPQSLVFDRVGNLYIAERGKARILRVPAGDIQSRIK